MPEKRTVERARRDLRQGESPSSAAGEFVKEEIEHVREAQAPRLAAQVACGPAGASQRSQAHPRGPQPRRAQGGEDAECLSACATPEAPV